MRSQTWATPQEAVAGLNALHEGTLETFTLRDVAKCDKCARWDNRGWVRELGDCAMCCECYVGVLEGWMVRPSRRQPIGFVPPEEPQYTLLFQL